MNKILIVVDMQKDFVSGSLGSPEARAIIPAARDYICSFEGNIIVTYDTHGEDYLETPEGRKLPVPHCIEGTDGWELADEIGEALKGKSYTTVKKSTFGKSELPGIIEELFGKPSEIELMGLCTDICVISNALILKNAFPDADTSVNGALCAGVTPLKHQAALEVMASCQITVK